jgi:protein-tyrosine phosphatase
VRAELYWIAKTWPGKLAIFPRPRGGDWLPDEVQDWVAAGLQVIVSLLTAEEVAELGLTQEAELCQSHGLVFISFPIVDRSIPTSRAETSRLASHLADLLKEEKSLGIHCRQGIGRASLVAACALIQTGVSADAAFALIGEARGLAVPETVEQECWVKEFAT